MNKIPGYRIVMLNFLIRVVKNNIAKEPAAKNQIKIRGS